ncbi:unnamed protein product [Lepeophtheirus salmonis]|uniref:(salmon louse) hypothetical protein n=1 Tax=Lepeophtheirus salmonis TaxID=72036 RepID=A0A7R8HE25_LEPSM|nr:unnamed protein product [Lepeophtheirus salmonis]CAF3046875.1 unnamed protein product [Lepeophtheirus salmonis]
MQEENVESLPNTTSLRLAYTSYESKTKKDISPLIMNHNLMGNRSNLSRIAKEINQTTRRMIYLKHVFLGNGMGGRVGMLLALNRPSLIDRLIVINSTPLNHMSIMQRVEKIKKAGQIMETCKEEIENAEGIVGKKSIADKILTPILTDSFDRSLFLTNLVPSNTEDKRWKLNFNALATSPLGVFPTFGEGTTFNGPCLFITGDKCDYLKEPDREEVTKLFPNAKFIRISHTGYWLQVENFSLLGWMSVPSLPMKINPSSDKEPPPFSYIGGYISMNKSSEWIELDINSRVELKIDKGASSIKTFSRYSGQVLEFNLLTICHPSSIELIVDRNSLDWACIKIGFHLPMARDRSSKTCEGRASKEPLTGENSNIFSSNQTPSINYDSGSSKSSAYYAFALASKDLWTEGKSNKLRRNHIKNESGFSVDSTDWTYTKDKEYYMTDDG